MAVSETRVTRGRLLKRAGVGAAVLGAGSMFSASTAGAAAPPSKACIAADGCGSCAGQTLCAPDCCSCIITTEGCCFCHNYVFCTGLKVCTSSSQCPPGWACSYSCCGDLTTAYCHPHCGYAGHHSACIDGARVTGAGKRSSNL